MREAVLDFVTVAIPFTELAAVGSPVTQQSLYLEVD